MFQKIRRQKGHTLKKASEAIGISPTTLHLLETGKRLPSSKTRKKLSKYFNLSESKIIQLFAVLHERRKKIEELDAEFAKRLLTG